MLLTSEHRTRGRCHVHRRKGVTHLYQVVPGIAGTERPLEKQVESVTFVFGFQQLVVLLAVQRNVTLVVAPRILKENTRSVERVEL